MSSKLFDAVVSDGPAVQPTLGRHLYLQMCAAWEALAYAFAANGAYVELTRHGVEPSDAAQIVLISHFSQRG